MTRVVFFGHDGAPEGVANFVYPENVEGSGGVIVSDEETSDEEIIATWYLQQGEVETRQPQPTRHHVWKSDLGEWVEDLYELRQDKLSEVDHLAEVDRGKYITPGSGQAMTYEAKVREARAGAGPMIEAEAEALEMTVEEVAASVLAAHDQWQAAGGQIEAARLKAKKDIRAATTSSEMHQAVETFKNSMP